MEEQKKDRINDKNRNTLLLKKLFQKKPYSSLYRCKANQHIPFFSKHSPIQPSFFIKMAANIADKKIQYASMSTKDSDKEKSLKKIKQNKTFNIFNTFKKQISKVHSDILEQYKSHISDNYFITNQIKDNVNILAHNLMKSNEEFDMTKEATCIIHTNSLRLSTDCHRIFLENEEQEYEINKLKEENENMKNTIMTLDKEKMVLLNTIQSISYEIEGFNKEIQRAPKKCETIENNIKNVKTSILIWQKRTIEVKLDMDKNDKRIEWLNRQIGNHKKTSDKHKSVMKK